MTRDRRLRPRWLIWLVIAWSVAIASVPRLGDAAPLPPAREGRAAGDLEDVRALLEHHLVREQLRVLGVSESEAAELAARADELRAGGDPVAAGVAIAIIVAMAVILVLELIGRRVISRPSTGAEP